MLLFDAEKINIFERQFNNVMDFVPLSSIVYALFEGNGSILFEYLIFSLQAYIAASV